MTVAYATEADLEAFLPDGTVVPDAARLLERASDLMDATVRRPYAVDSVTQLPTEQRIADALRDASCAQVEYWLDLGEDHDVEGLAGRHVRIGHLDIDALPPRVGPRAADALKRVGLLSIGSADARAPWELV